MTLKLFNLKIILGYWNENIYIFEKFSKKFKCFHFSNPKQFSNLIVLEPFYSSCWVIKNADFLFLTLKLSSASNVDSGAVFYAVCLNCGLHFFSNFILTVLVDDFLAMFQKRFCKNISTTKFRLH